VRQQAHVVSGWCKKRWLALGSDLARANLRFRGAEACLRLAGQISPAGLDDRQADFLTTSGGRIPPYPQREMRAGGLGIFTRNTSINCRKIRRCIETANSGRYLFARHRRDRTAGFFPRRTLRRARCCAGGYQHRATDRRCGSSQNGKPLGKGSAGRSENSRTKMNFGSFCPTTRTFKPDWAEQLKGDQRLTPEAALRLRDDRAQCPTAKPSLSKICSTFRDGKSAGIQPCRFSCRIMPPLEWQLVMLSISNQH